MGGNIKFFASGNTASMKWINTDGLAHWATSHKVIEAQVMGVLRAPVPLFDMLEPVKLRCVRS